MLPGQTIARALPAGAISATSIFHQRTLDDAEKSALMKGVLDNLRAIEKVEKEIKDFVDERKLKIKQLQSESKVARTLVEQGYEGQDLEVFCFVNAEKQTIDHVAVDGDEVLWSRPMHPKEREQYLTHKLQAHVG